MAFSELSSSNQVKNTKKKQFFLKCYNAPASAPDGDETKVWFQKWQRKCVTDGNDKALSTAGDTIIWNAFPLCLSNMSRASYTI